MNESEYCPYLHWIILFILHPGDSKQFCKSRHSFGFVAGVCSSRLQRLFQKVQTGILQHGVVLPPGFVTRFCVSRGVVSVEHRGSQA
jgi:hypothetical protein